MMTDERPVVGRSLQEQIGLIAFFVLLLTFLGLAVFLLVPFASPLLCALSAAIILWPAHCWVARRMPSSSRTWRAFLSAMAALVLVVGPLVVVTISASNEAVAYWPSVKEHLLIIKNRIDDPDASPPPWAARLPPSLTNRLEKTLRQSQEKIVTLGNHAAEKAAALGASLAVNLLLLVANILLFEIVLFFLLRDGDRLRRQWNELLPFPEELKKRLQHRAKSVVQGVFRGIVIVGLIQTAILAIAYLIVGVQGFVVLTAITAVSTLIPGIGVGLVWIPVAIVFFTKGVIWKGITMIVLGVIAGTCDNILRPLIAGPAMELPLLWFLLALLGGLNFFGALGILLGPMIFAILPILLDAYRAYLEPAE